MIRIFQGILFLTMACFAESPKIVVIGAGLAGLTTAYRLQEKGLHVELYEARHRVGGRVLSARLNGQIVELGGQSIGDGAEAKNILKLAQNLGLEVNQQMVAINDSYFDGERFIPLKQLIKPFDSITLRKRLDELAEESLTMHDVLKGIIDENDPLFAALSVKLSAYEGGPLTRLSSRYIDTLYHMLLGGISVAHQSQEVNLVSIKDGNSQLPQAIAERLGDCVHLGKVLRQVSKSSSGGFFLTFEDGEKIFADIAVLAMPCSVYSDIHFEDGLISFDKLEQMQKIAYGANAKIILPLKKPIFDGKGLINDHLVSFADSWNKSFVLYYTGEAAKFSDESIGELYKKDRSFIEQGLLKECPPFESPTYALDLPFIDYEGPIGYCWPLDPYSKGSYSYVEAGQEAILDEMLVVKNETVKKLFAPIDGKLYFAGEHTSILHEVPGTMEAACESGERTARLILSEIL